ncbi:unnamed protein product [Auanema sp. JU1783]|nr:unnamed protein product [Auanema sp. JU1783]
MWKFLCFLPLLCLVLYSFHHRLTEPKFWLEDGKEVRELRTNLLNQLIPHSDGLMIRDITIPTFCQTDENRKKIGEGWQKVVFEADSIEEQSGSIIKVPNLNGPNYISCLESLEVEMCRLFILRNSLREIRWMSILKNDNNVIQIKSYCIPEDPIKDIDKLSIRTEKGFPLTTLFLIQQTWGYRFNMIREIVQFLLRHPNISFNDFRRQQFVVVDDHPKMVDLDGITFGSFDIDGELITQKVIKEFVNNYLLLDIPNHLRTSFNTSKIHSIRTLSELDSFLKL